MAHPIAPTARGENNFCVSHLRSAFSPAARTNDEVKDTDYTSDGLKRYLQHLGIDPEHRLPWISQAHSRRLPSTNLYPIVTGRRSILISF
ncbi:MAG: hypothetical protein ACM3ZQ_01515 [Bacillota bacterium]